MEQSIFKTIVEMANEMDYADKRQENINLIVQRMNEMVVESRLDTRTNLRSLTVKPTQGHDHYTEPFLVRNNLLRVACYMEYERYLNENNKVRELGVVTLSIQRPLFDKWTCSHRLVYSRKEYHSREEFQPVLEDLKPRFLHWFGYYTG